MPDTISPQLRSWAERLNGFGRLGQPCFFLVDFELERPQLWSLDELGPAGVRFSFPAHADHRITSAEPPPLVPRHISPRRYEQAFSIVRAGIQRGDSFLVNLTFPTPVAYAGSLTSLFEHSQAKYRILYPGNFVCFSPETFVTVDARGYIETRPMKGTAPNTPAGRAYLLGSQKEVAEHATIVDLMRNDLSRIARQVNVTEYRYLRPIESGGGGLLQTSTRLGGQLPGDWRSRLGDLLIELLPAGSVSGAPKSATLDLIRRAEIDRRGYYCGIGGYYDGNTLDSCVIIRYVEQVGGAFNFRSGGGVTARSTPTEEYAELRAKIRVPRREK
ncbi:aminodeoxychorismate synthase component I [Neolewinella litorea]|uniref:Aminodeoxychorismate synthase component I n=1 Tax=Neolewinella litorea TaxID=2562452 RepID=A0A4S4NQA5_9BACT|nr:aminodeoxychorismate synthase component I [Neolewinella litorea]THH41327.1 aminodeoxychorismate synthase component I [Neolewinella litorea]